MNLAEVFVALRSKYRTEEVFRRVGSSEETLTYNCINSPNKDRMTVKVAVPESEAEFKRRLHSYIGQNIVNHLLLGWFGDRRVPVVNQFSLAYLAHELIKKGGYTIDGLADRLQEECLKGYLENGVSDVDIYVGAINYLEGLIPK